MNVILRAARIIDPKSAFHNQVMDLLIENGTIKKIGANNVLKNYFHHYHRH